MNVRLARAQFCARVLMQTDTHTQPHRLTRNCSLILILAGYSHSDGNNVYRYFGDMALPNLQDFTALDVVYALKRQDLHCTVLVANLPLKHPATPNTTLPKKLTTVYCTCHNHTPNKYVFSPPTKYNATSRAKLFVCCYVKR